MNKIKNIFTLLKKDFSLKSTILSSVLLLLSSSLAFPAGAFSKGIYLENCANYYSEISKQYTVPAGKKKLSGLIVEPNDPSVTQMRTDTDNAITELWGVFKGQNASFAPVINANRDYDIRFVDQNYSDESVPLVYSNIGQSAEVYHTKNGNPVDYKFQSSPLALMFPSSNQGMHSSLHIYISQTQAEKKLNSLGMEITKENLQSLQKTRTEMQIGDTIYNCVIDNIYLDNFDHYYKHADYDYYYATDVGTVLGDFVFVIFYAVWPKNCPPESSIKRESLYIMSEYSFRNKYFLKYAIESYSPKDYSFRICNANLKNNFIPDDSILERAIYPEITSFWCVFITMVSIIIFVLNNVLILKKKLFQQPITLFTLISCSIVPYIVFKVVFILSNQLLLFSWYSLFFYMLIIVFQVLILALINSFGREKKVSFGS